MAKLYFRYGAMGSSKTANAVMVQYNYRERGQRVLMLKPKIENRDGATVVRSRCGLVAQCRYVEELGGIDLQLLGMGHNGHIAFNEPGDDFGLETHVVDLTESTIEANKRFFESRDEVPRHALSMGIKNIMNARRILMVVSGEEKADIVCKAFTGPVTKEVPASVLQLHPDVTLVGDKAALHKLVEAGVTVCG